MGIAVELQDKTGMGVCHCNMGTTYEILCNLEEALEHHEKVSQTSSDLKYAFTVGCVDCVILLFLLFLFLLFLLLLLPLSTHQHLELTKDANSLHGQALALSNIAKTYEYMANVSRACETLETVSLRS